MPRGKRRVAEMAPAEDDRLSSKRQRSHYTRYAWNLIGIFMQDEKNKLLERFERLRMMIGSSLKDR